MITNTLPAAARTSPLTVNVCPIEELPAHHSAWYQLLGQQSLRSAGRDPRWVAALCDGLRHSAYVLTAKKDNELVGVLPLILVNSLLFGRFLVSLPYVNTAGVVTSDEAVARELISAAINIAHQQNVKYLELRHEAELTHEGLPERSSSKVHMRLALPPTVDDLMASFKSKLRSQIRNGEKKGLNVAWGGKELLPDFYNVFSHNMRDLGTPAYGRRLFLSILNHFGSDAELCVVRTNDVPIAAGLLIHSQGVTEVPSASSLRNFNHLNANMVLYWNLLQRAVEKGQQVFDFGRSEKDGSHFKFKEQWGARPSEAVWQFHIRRGNPADMRPQTSKYRFFIRAWQKLPVRMARMIGPAIVRGIP